MNPLLETGDLPAFDRIAAGHVVPAVEQTLRETRASIERLLDSGGPYSWDDLLAPLELALERLQRVWSPVSHLNAVRNSEDLRNAYNIAWSRSALSIPSWVSTKGCIAPSQRWPTLKRFGN
jgi:oligopeptidase A